MKIASRPDNAEALTVTEAIEEFPGEELDMTPPPDHEGWLEACANGLRATRERWEKRRRKK